MGHPAAAKIFQSTPPGLLQMLLMSEALPPLGRILEFSRYMETAGEEVTGTGMEIWQEEVPGEGCEVLRRYILSRTSEGGLLLWRGRQKKTGRGEGSSGLQYDRAE